MATMEKFELIAVMDERELVNFTIAWYVETPALLPVINPNIRTIEPREMWDRYGIQD